MVLYNTACAFLDAVLRGDASCLIVLLFATVFKIFVANPSKSRPIVEILARNKVKLMDFLVKFQTEKGTSVVLSF